MTSPTKVLVTQRTRRLLFESSSAASRGATPGAGLPGHLPRHIAHGGSIRGDTIHNAQNLQAHALRAAATRHTMPTDLGTDTDTTSEV